MAEPSDLFDPTDPAHMTPQTGLGEVAAVLAAGVLRMRERRRKRAIASPQLSDFSESGESRLESFPAEVALVAGVVNTLRERSCRKFGLVLEMQR